MAARVFWWEFCVMTWLRKRLYLLAATVVLSTAIGFFVMNSPSLAQQVRCAAHERVLDFLAKNFAEQPVGIGVTQQGGLLEILASSSGSWTAIISSPTGVSCIVATGEGWRSLEVETTDGPLASISPEMDLRKLHSSFGENRL